MTQASQLSFLENSTGTITISNTGSSALSIAGGVIVAGQISGGGTRTTSASTPPSNPGVGDIWYNTLTDTVARYTSDGVTSVWLDITGPTVTNAFNGGFPGGSNTQVQYNSSGSFAGSANLTFDGTNVKVANSLSSANTFGFKNRIINGAMVIDQRNAGASVTNDTSGIQFSVDRWNIFGQQASKFTAQQTPSATETGYATRINAGFTNYLAITSSSAYSVLTGDRFIIRQKVEGLNCPDLAWGTSNAKIVTLSFLAYSSLTGTFGGSIMNSTQDRNYLFSYSIPTANTWTQISITITGDTSGTWLTTNGIGMQVWFGLGSGATYTGTANTWQAGNLAQPTGTVSVVGTNGATWYVTGVQLEVGTQATSFDFRDYTRELQMCQRYYSKLDLTKTLVYATTTAYAQGNYRLPVTMRAAPTSIATTATNMNELYVANITGTYVPSSSCDTDSVWIVATNTGGTAFTANHQYRFNSVGCNIDFSSEL